jgi:C_GCAxxG_C_C family probable redox protein
MNTPEKAVSTFDQGFCCSQAVLSTFGEELGLDRTLALKLAESFGGGMGRMGLTCGAVTGAFMVIGLKHGRTSADDLVAKENTTRVVGEFVAKFEERNNTIVCKELLGWDISTERGHQRAKEHNLFETLCPKFVADAAEILEEIL